MHLPSPSPARLAATRIVRDLRAAGHMALFAGGCVRDELLGREPSDYDVATDATPDQLARIFPRTAQVGAHFGVMLVKIDRQVIEVAAFRSDGTYSDARRPDTVRFSSPREDARRRDFTVNALFLDPLPSATDPYHTHHAALAQGATSGDAPPIVRETPRGTVIDFVGGLADLDARVLRAVGDPEARLAEDHLRALRAVRLSAKLGFAIEPATALAITRHARDLRGVSRERIGDEVRAILDHRTRALACQSLEDLGLLEPVLGRPRQSSPGPLSTLAGLATPASLGLCLCAWLLDLGLLDHRAAPTDGGHDPAVRSVRQALCLSNQERLDLLHAWEGLAHLHAGAWDQSTIAQRKRFAGGPRFAPGLALLRAQEGAGAPRADRIEQHVRELAHDGVGIDPAPILTGDHLVAWGLRPGPKFRELLDLVYDAQLTGQVRNLADARELVDRLRV